MAGRRARLARGRREHPRHVVLFALAAGLALGPISAPATALAVVVAAAVSGRRALATLATGAVLLGAVVADARLAALDAGVLAQSKGQRWEGAATLLEPVREHGRHASARVWLNALGERPCCDCVFPKVDAGHAVDRSSVPAGRVERGRSRRSRRRVGTGTRRRCLRSIRLATRRRRHGGVRPRRAARPLRRVSTAAGSARGAGGRPVAARVSPGGLVRRAGRTRRRAEAGLGRGLAAPEAALLAGMVLGQDERLSEAVRTTSSAPGLPISWR